MEIKKNPKVDLENKKGIFLEVGMIIALAICIIALSVGQEKKTIEIMQISGPEIEMDLVDITKPEEPKPQAPVKQAVQLISDFIKVVKNDTKIDTTFDFAEFTEDEIIVEEIEVEDYDWDSITKAVKSFVKDYNDVVEQAGNSDSKDVLRNAVWLTGMTGATGKTLSKIGITIGKGNKLELDEETLKKSDISTLKTLFSGYNSFADKVSVKANGIMNAAARSIGTYKSNGKYSNVLSELVSGKVDKEI